MENTHSWTCDNEIGTTLPQYANSQGITYEAVRRQVIKYQDTELRGHIQIRNKTKYLDDFAVEFLNEHRRPQAQIDSDANNIAEQLKDMLIYIKENKSNPQKAHQFQPFKDYIYNTPEDAFAQENHAATTPSSKEKPPQTNTNPLDESIWMPLHKASPDRQLIALQTENELLKKQLSDLQNAYNKLLVETSNLTAKIYYAEKHADNAEKNSKRWYNLALECIKTFNQQQAQDFNATESEAPDDAPED